MPESEKSNKVTIEDQVAEFLEDWPVVGEEPTKVVVASSEEPAEEEPTEEVLDGESAEPAIPAKAEPKGEEPGGEEPEEELTFDEEKEALRQEVELLSERLTGNVPDKEVKEASIAAPTIGPQEAAQALHFVDPETLESVLTNPDKFNKLISKVVEVAAQRALAATPSIIRKQEDERNELIEATQTFYDKNKDLVKYHRNISLTAQQVKSLNPNFTVRQVLDESEKLVRERLRLTKTAETIEGKRKAGLKSGPQRASNVSKKGGMTVTDEIEMFKNL